ncbi:MAG: type II toxin-antitoxin system RelE/ParE family toxin [Sulfuricella sp.]
MTRIELASEVGDDLDRILEHLAQFEVNDAPARIREIIQAIDVLEQNPLIGRPISEDQRELVIGRRTRGYVALYRYIEEIDTVFVLALRSQREAGFTRPFEE